ncbi:MAG: MFS transporter [Planctomycetaceae bacterium]|nr:MFS transporter [Planctomycetaceae bacterium]
MSIATPETAVLHTGVDAPATRVRWIVAVWLAMAAAIAYLSRTSIGAAQDGIRSSLSLTEAQMGFVMGPAFFWPYALTQIPTAWLGQRFGSRLMLSLFTAGSSLAVLVFSGAASLPMLLLAWMAMGIGQAGMFPCATQTIAHWHPLTERGRASGLLGGSMQAGSVIGLTLAGFLIGLVGWRGMFLLFALPGFVWAIGFARWFRNSPREHPWVNAAECTLIAGGAPPAADRVPAHVTPWSSLLGSPTMWLICTQQFFRAGGQVFFATWFPKYLQETRGVTLQQSAWLTALPVVSFMLAAFVGGGLSDFVLLRTGSLNAARKGVATVTLLACAGIIGAAWFVEHPLAAVSLISLGIFLAGFSGPCSYALTIDVGGRHVPAVFSTMNMFGNFGAGLMPWLVPHFRATVERLASGSADAVHTSWAAILLLFAATYLAAAFCWVWLRIEPNSLDK